MSNHRVISAENLENCTTFDPTKLIVDIDNIAFTKPTTNICGMFIPIKLQVPSGLTTFKIQTPECTGFMSDCDPLNPGKQHKISLKINSTDIDPSFLADDVKYQKETVEILENFQSAIVEQLKVKQEQFNHKFQEKNKRKMTQNSWNSMLDSFEVVRSHIKTSGGTDYYINPKIFNTSRFKTSFIFNGLTLSNEDAVEKFFNKKVYCVALVSIDSLFFQATSNKIFIQAKVERFFVTRLPCAEAEKIVMPDRLLARIKPESIEETEEKPETEENPETEQKQETDSYDEC